MKIFRSYLYKYSVVICFLRDYQGKLASLLNQKKIIYQSLDLIHHAHSFNSLLILSCDSFVQILRIILNYFLFLKGLALALGIPVFVVVTKIDMAPGNVLQETMKILQKILRSQGSRKIPLVVQTNDDVITCATNFTSERLCPIFQVSNVTGENLDLLKKFLNLLSTRMESCVDEPADFQIDDLYAVPGVGTVVSGTTLKGTIRVGDNLQLGPDSLGQYKTVQIRSLSLDI